MRLAQLEMKMALVRLFHRFTLVACSETKVSKALSSVFRTIHFVKITTPQQRMEVMHAAPMILSTNILFLTYYVLSYVQVPLELKSSSTLGPKNGVFVKIERRHLGESQVNSSSDD